MCVMSMVMDHRYEEWYRRFPPVPPAIPPWTVPYVAPKPLGPTQEEIDEFRRLLDRAREYDRKHNEPDCELEEKRIKLKKLAGELGVDISFV